MTPEAVQKLLEHALDARLLPWWYTPLVGFFVVAVVSVATIWLKKYLEGKAERLARKEDLDHIVDEVRKTTRATEEIKAEISSQLWEVQTRWSFKRDLYVRLLEALGGLALALRQLMYYLDVDPKADASEETRRLISENMALLKDHTTKLRTTEAVARIVLHEEALKAVDDFLAEWVRTQGEKGEKSDYTAAFCGALYGKVIEAITRLTDAAKRDLLVRPTAGEKPF